jgi:alkylation response protein AidB-like acyl-CoA dehydrogenase
VEQASGSRVPITVDLASRGTLQSDSRASEGGLTAFRRRVRDWMSQAVRVLDGSYDETLPEVDRLALRRQWDKLIWSGGFAGITWPVEYGGLGLGIGEQITFYEEAALAGAPEELDIVGKVVAGPAIIAYGTEEQRRTYLPAILSSAQVWCEGFSEPEAGSDLAAVTTTASRVGDEYEINGTKVWTTHAQLADRCYLLARTAASGARYQNLSVFLVDMHQAGVSVSPIRELTGASLFNQVVFDGVVVHRRDLLGEANDGWKIVSLRGFRRLNQVFEASRRYNQLSQWVRDLERCRAECDGERHVVEQLAVEVELLRWHVWRVAELAEADREWFRPASVLQLYWTELMQRIASQGFDTACAAHLDLWRQRYLDSRAATIYGGSSQIQRNVVTSHVLALPR